MEKYNESLINHIEMENEDESPSQMNEQNPTPLQNPNYDRHYFNQSKRNEDRKEESQSNEEEYNNHQMAENAEIKMYKNNDPSQKGIFM